ncbi:hypothetical protein [Microlunatus sp. GCM10028923]|uniref:hypothetical protein n=1 Tax=Microlunatus sp. GCM10028923 TaxID=3273400 RepID=UPI0036157B3D
MPAVLGVTFSLLAASSLVVIGASAHANARESSETIDWQGTFFVAPRVPIDPEFDRALTAGVIDDLAKTMPQITGGHALEAVAHGSSVGVEARLPDGRNCPAGELVHAAS